MNYDNTTVSILVSFCMISYLIGYSVDGYCNNTVIEMLRDDIVHLDQRDQDLENQSGNMPYVITQPVSPSSHRA